MISKKEFYTQGNACPVRVVLYDNPDVIPKACILYFHGGGLLLAFAGDFVVYTVAEYCSHVGLLSGPRPTAALKFCSRDRLPSSLLI